MLLTNWSSGNNGPEVDSLLAPQVCLTAIFSIVESCRKLGIPIRQYLATTLPGLADRSIHELASLTPTAYAAQMAK